MEDIKLKKQYLRKKYREIRDNIPEKQRKRKSREICRNLFADADISKNKIISLYAPIKSEVDISLLIELYLEEGNIITLPRIDEYEKTLDFKRYKIGVELIKSKKYGIFEPSENYCLC
jgi:5,10-methenyltetrahydrofolate synthetase